MEGDMKESSKTINSMDKVLREKLFMG